MNKDTQKVKDLLTTIYGHEKGGEAFNRILPLIEAFPRRPEANSGYFSERDAILITYGDTLNKPDEAKSIRLAAVQGLLKAAGKK